MRRGVVLGARLLLAAAAAACASHGDTSGVADRGGPTFHADVAPLLAARCQACHVTGGIAPFPLVTYEDARPYAAAIATATATGEMPPWRARATPSCAPPLPYKDDPRLGPAELALLEAWARAGAPEGAARSAAAAPARAGSLDRVDLALETEPFELSDEEDAFRCYVFDPALAGERWVRGSEVLPTDPRAVHHATLLADPARTLAGKAAPGASFACDPAGAFEPSVYAVNAWTPGQPPNVLPEDVGVPLPPGALLVLQVHYSPAAGGVTGGARVHLRFHDAPPPHRLAFPTIGDFASREANGDGLQPGPGDPPGGPTFRVPAGARAHTETMLYTVPAASSALLGTIYGVLAHEHLAGVGVEVHLEKAGGGDTCLLYDAWDFHWQRIYAFDGPRAALPVVQPGDRIRVTCTYDDTLGNPRLAAELARRHEAPSDIVLGRTTRDEMCHAVLEIAP